MTEYFLDLNRERTMERLKTALARGRKGSRRPKLTEADLAVGREFAKVMLRFLREKVLRPWHEFCEPIKDNFSVVQLKDSGLLS